MTMALKALTTAFLKWQEEQLKLVALGKQSTWEMYRRKLKVLNRNKLIVFVGQHFGIFHPMKSLCWPMYQCTTSQRS